MFKLAIIYDSGKRYIVPFEILEELLDEETLVRIRARVKKEVQKL